MSGLIKRFFLILTGFSGVASACSVCFGDPESNMTQGMNIAILTLLAVVGILLISFGAFFIYLNKKGKSAQSAEV